jgi:hypothetical protein
MPEMLGSIGLGHGRLPAHAGSLLHDRYVSAVAKGRDNTDWSAAALGVREDAGLK